MQELKDACRRLKESKADRANLHTQAEEAKGTNTIKRRNISSHFYHFFFSVLMTICRAAAAEAAEKLKSELATARQEAEDGKAAAEKAKADLEALKTTSNQLESRVGEVEKSLQEAAVKYEALEEEKKKQDQ